MAQGHKKLAAKKIVDAMRQKRDEEGLSIRALSAKIGVSFSTLARIERGEGEPDNNTKIRLLNWLGSEGQEFGLSYKETALVHFRAAKNVGTKTVHCLLDAADCIKRRYSEVGSSNGTEDISEDIDSKSVARSKAEMETFATNLRKEIGISLSDALDSLRLRISGVDVFVIADIHELKDSCGKHLLGQGMGDWSAMTVPIDSNDTQWAILRNDAHPIERQRVTYLEECWHILLGHKLTKISKIGDAFGRTFDPVEEHDAFFLAAATMLPKNSVANCVRDGLTSTDIAVRFGVSRELVEYRIKRLGLWRKFKNIGVTLD